MAEKFECKFCHKSFSNVYNLRAHVNSAKYCLALRKDAGVLYHCDHCKSQFARKKTLTDHQNGCVKYKDFLLREKDILLENFTLLNKNIVETNEKLKTLNSELEETHKKDVVIIEEQKTKIAKLEKIIEYKKGYVKGFERVKPPNVVNNNMTVVQKLKALPITTIEPLTINLIKNSVYKYDYDMYLRAELGVVQFITDVTILELEDGTIEKNYTCTDRSRKVFHRLLNDEKWAADGGANFINKILDNLSSQIGEHSDRLDLEIANAPANGTLKEVLSKKESELRPFYIGITQPRSREREAVFQKIRNRIKDINHIDSVSSTRLIEGKT